MKYSHMIVGDSQEMVETPMVRVKTSDGWKVRRCTYMWTSSEVLLPYEQTHYLYGNIDLETNYTVGKDAMETLPVATPLTWH